MRVVASIEARMGSSRLPRKMVADIAGRPTLARVIDRLKETQTVDEIVLATTASPEDETLVRIADAEGITASKGSEDDVLGRVVNAHRMMNSEVVVQVCGDCPLLDPDIVDQAVELYRANECDLIAAGVKRSFPQGTEAQVCSLKALVAIAATTSDSACREHVTLYFHKHSQRYRIIHLMAPAALQRPEQRLQLDYAEDLELIRTVYAALEPKFGHKFRTADILAFLDCHPEVAHLNSHCVERPAC